MLVLVLCAGAQLAAQDRVVLLDLIESATNRPLQIQIRDFAITDGGRQWSFVRSVSMPPYCGRSRPLSLADGSRVVLLAQPNDCYHPPEPLMLVQYELATGRTSIVDIGRFDTNAILVADPLLPRVFVIEPTRVIAIDDRLRVTTLDPPGPFVTLAADAAGRYLAIERGTSRSSSSAYDVVVIDTQIGAIVRNLPLEGGGAVQISREGRLYVSFLCRSTFPAEYCLDAKSLETGELLARVRSVSNFVALHDVDDAHGVVVTHEFNRLVGRDVRTLVPLGEIRVGSPSESRSGFQVQQTRQERAILVYSRQAIFEWCAFESPRIDVFDGDTFLPIKSVDLQGRCPVMLAVPPR